MRTILSLFALVTTVTFIVKALTLAYHLDAILVLTIFLMSFSLSALAVYTVMELTY